LCGTAGGLFTDGLLAVEAEGHVRLTRREDGNWTIANDGRSRFAPAATMWPGMSPLQTSHTPMCASTPVGCGGHGRRRGRLATTIGGGLVGWRRRPGAGGCRPIESDGQEASGHSWTAPPAPDPRFSGPDVFALAAEVGWRSTLLTGDPGQNGSGSCASMGVRSPRSPRSAPLARRRALLRSVDRCAAAFDLRGRSGCRRRSIDRSDPHLLPIANADCSSPRRNEWPSSWADCAVGAHAA
jgi:hypothetical protein